MLAKLRHRTKKMKQLSIGQACLAIMCIMYSSCGYHTSVDSSYRELSEAVLADNVGSASRLCQRGAKLYDRCYGSLWHVIAHKYPEHVDIETIKFVESLNLDVNYENRYGQTALFDYNCSKDILDCMIRHGADINHRDEDGHTALTSLYHYIFPYDYGEGEKIDEEAMQKYFDRLELLISYGADVNILVNGKTILDYLQEPPCKKWVKLGMLPERYKETRQRIKEYLITKNARYAKDLEM